MGGAAPLRLAFLGCGFITRVHSRVLRAFGGRVERRYASRDSGKADAWCRRLGGTRAYGDYASAIEDPEVDAVIVAVPPVYHLDLVLRALAAGKHVLVEKPALLTVDHYQRAIAARNRASRIVLVAENDHYKPLVRTLRRLIADDTIGELVLAQFVTVANRQKEASDWRNDEATAGGDAFFEEGIHWLNVAGSLGPRIQSITGYRPAVAATGADRRSKTMLAAFQYDSGAAGAIFYSREVPSAMFGLRFSKLFGRRGVITFESNGGIVVTSGRTFPRVLLPGWWRDVRGYRAMYDDFLGAIDEDRAPAMSLERALEDHRLMEQIYTSRPGAGGVAGAGREPGTGSPESAGVR